MNPIFHVIPFLVIPNEQVFLFAVGALDSVLVVVVELVVLGELSKRGGHLEVNC